LGDPVGFVDPNGLEAHVIFWQPVGYGTSSFGHISVKINKISYSWGPSGMDIRQYTEYESRNTKFRNGVAVKLNINLKQEKNLKEYLKDYGKNNSYWAVGKNCGEPIEAKLQDFGFDIGDYIFPGALFLDIMINAGIESFNIDKKKIN